MPTIEELGQKVKAKYPGQYDDLSDVEVGQKVKSKYPEAYKDFQAGSTFEKIPVSQKAKEHLASMQAGPAKKQFEQAQESATKDIKGSYVKAAGDVAAAAPFLAAGAATGGLSLIPALGAMGGLGLAGGVMREGIHLAAGEKPKSAEEYVTTLGVDAATGMIGEGIGRGIGVVTKTLLPRLMIRATARAEGGKAVLDQHVYNIRRELEKEIETYAMAGNPAAAVVEPGTALVKAQARPAGQRMVSGLRGVDAPVISETGTYWVDAGRPIKEAFDAIGKQVKAEPPLSKFSGMSDKAGEFIRETEKALNLNHGSVSNMQRLDALIEVKGRLNEFAWTEGSLTRDEGPIFKKLTGEIDSIIKENLKDIGPQASELYEQANYIWKVQKENNIATRLAEKSISAWVRHKSIGAGIGGAYGYMAGGGAAGAITGAATGVAVELVGPKVAKLALEQVMAHPQGATMMKNAVRFFVQGDKGKASALAVRALAVAGVRNTVKAAMEGDETSATPPTP